MQKAPPDRRRRAAGRTAGGGHPRRHRNEGDHHDAEGHGAEGVVERLVPGGHGLVRDDEGVIFLDGVVPGERVRYAASARRGGARHGRLLAVLQPSSARVTPSCPHADPARAPAGRVCGGCDWLHLNDEARARGKEAIVDDVLRRIGRLPTDVVAAVRAPLRGPGAGDPDGARRRTRLHVDDDGRVGFFARHTDVVVTVDDCEALAAPLRGVLARLPRLAPGGEVRLATDDRGQVVAAVTRDELAEVLVNSAVVHGGVVVDERRGRERTWGNAQVAGEVTAGLFDARSDAACFTQATRAGGRAIVDAVVTGVADVLGAAGRASVGATVLELFAGSGHLTLPLAARGARVDAVEGDPRGTRYLVENVARLTPADSVRVRRAYIDGTLAFGAVDVVVADPPRTGIPGAATLFARLRTAGAAGLVLVSCDPATGARDLRAAIDAGFVLRRVVPLDAFPRTHHVEWVATLDTPR